VEEKSPISITDGGAAYPSGASDYIYLTPVFSGSHKRCSVRMHLVVFRLHASKKDIQYNGQKKKDKNKEYTKHYTEY
jgi:hypothetical protein